MGIFPYDSLACDKLGSFCVFLLCISFRISCPEIINGVTVPASFSPPDSLNIHAMFLDGELQYRKSPQTVPVQFNPEAMTLTGGQEY